MTLAGLAVAFVAVLTVLNLDLRRFDNELSFRGRAHDSLERDPRQGARPGGAQVRAADAAQPQARARRPLGRRPPLRGRPLAREAHAGSARASPSSSPAASPSSSRPGPTSSIPRGSSCRRRACASSPARRTTPPMRAARGRGFALAARRDPPARARAARVGDQDGAAVRLQRRRGRALRAAGRGDVRPLLRPRLLHQPAGADVPLPRAVLAALGRRPHAGAGGDGPDDRVPVRAHRRRGARARSPSA